MTLKKGDEYIASLKSLGLEANVMGKKTQDLPDHPLVTPSVRAVASTFDCAYGEETRDLFRAESSLSGERLNPCSECEQKCLCGKVERNI